MRAHRLLALWLLVGCAAGRGPAAGAGEAAPTVDALLRSLSTRQKIAQLVMPWLSGSYTALDDSTFLSAARWVDSLEIGGILVSVGSPFDIAAKLNALQERARLPLLVSADLEWGAGMRVRGATVFPHIMAVGATNRPADAYAIGRAAALEGRAVGIHMNFAPTADVNNNPANPIINIRSFGEDPARVATLVQAYVRGLREHGMLATLKHFPGHGDTEIDSHIGLPVVRADYARLDTLELVPFRAGIAAGADVVMSAHIAFPALTGGTDPGTMSESILTGLLRDSLHFSGLIVTDALAMGAVVSKFGAGEAAVRAFLAGSDLLLMPADPAGAIDAMERAVLDGRIPARRLDASVRRVLAIKQRLGLFARRTVPLAPIIRTVGARELQASADDIAVRSLTVVRDGGALRALREQPGSLALIVYGDELHTYLGTRLTEALRSNGATVDFFRLWPMSGTLSYDSARAVVARQPRTVFVADVRPLSGRGTITMPDAYAALVTGTDAVKPTVLVSLGSPYLLDQAPRVKSYVLAWSHAPASERAVALALLGRVPITGRLPIRLPPNYAVGDGIMFGDTAAPASR